MQHEWREGNWVVLLPEASRFLPAMFDAVSQAQHYVLVELYLMESGSLPPKSSTRWRPPLGEACRFFYSWTATVRWGWSDATVNACRALA